MSARQVITVCALALSVFAACGNKKDVEKAKHSLYDTDFAVVYSAVLDTTRELYPNLDDNPGAGAVRTSWHQVTYANNTDDLSQGQTLSTGQASANQLGSTQGQAAAGMPTRLAYKRFFIRFDIIVAGGRPWRVKVTGHASEWEPGAALPVELHGASRPPWLDGRIDALTLAIYKKIRNYAVPMKELPPDAKPEDGIPKTDPKSFANIPGDAATRLAILKDAVAHREYEKLRAQVFDDVAWSIGGDPSADTALAMWQADPEVLDAMNKVIAGGCVLADPKKVTCGKQAVGGYLLVLELRGTDWKVSSFVKAE